jgi:hypothetical protein
MKVDAYSAASALRFAQISRFSSPKDMVKVNAKHRSLQTIFYEIVYAIMQVSPGQSRVYEKEQLT